MSPPPAGEDLLSLAGHPPVSQTTLFDTRYPSSVHHEQNVAKLTGGTHPSRSWLVSGIFQTDLHLQTTGVPWVTR